MSDFAGGPLENTLHADVCAPQQDVATSHDPDASAGAVELEEQLVEVEASVQTLTAELEACRQRATSEAEPVEPIDESAVEDDLAKRRRRLSK